MIQIENVHKSYRHGSRRIEALRGVDLRIDEPGFYAVMGPSGSGKSTLLHLMAGLDRPDGGRVVVDTTDLSSLSESRLSVFRRHRVGIVFQQYNLISTLSARQNVAMPAVIDRRPRRWINSRVDTLLDQLALSERAEHRPDALSGGEQQRAAIARALVFAPSVLLADEPTGALDSASSQRLWRLLGTLAQQKQMTIVMITHEPAAAVHCRRVFVLGDGQTQGEFEVDGLNAGDLALRYQQLGG